MKELSVGDLVCYNAAGMRKKSLGLVIATHKQPNPREKGMVYYVHIYWTLRPTLTPRAEWTDPRKGFPSSRVDYSNDRDKTQGWYINRGNFEALS